MLFDHDAKVSGDSARFADLPGGRRESAGPKEAVLGYRGRAMNLEATRCGDLLFAVAVGLGDHAAGHGDHADRDAVLRRPRRASSPATPAPSDSTAVGSARSPGDHTIGNLVADASLPVQVPFMAPARQAGPFGRYGPAGRRPLLAVL